MNDKVWSILFCSMWIILGVLGCSAIVYSIQFVEMRGSLNGGGHAIAIIIWAIVSCGIAHWITRRINDVINWIKK